ncbi:MAG: MarR family transcriptional regulator [Terracidiphilus sp.]|nr:MarR family transcriptional regulator [Terracidiphilus sp.]
MISMETTSEPAKKVAGLESHLGYLLRRVSNAVSGDFSRALQEKQTSVAEWVLLRELHERGRSQPGELADILGLTRGAVSKIVDKLEAKSWIRTETNQGDSRFRLLSLTRAGRHSLPVLAGLADQNEECFFKCLSARERNVLRELLVKLAQHNHIRDVPTD